MPYIKEEVRNRIDWGEFPVGPGELNYLITRIIREYYDLNEGYQGINDIIGALEGAKLEFYRRQVAKYEDQKIKENGDVYTC